MSLAQALSGYLNLNILVVIGFSGLWLVSFMTQGKMSARVDLKLHYAMALVVLALAVIHPFLPRSDMFAPAAKVWSAESIRSFSRDYTTPDKGGYLSLPTPVGTSTVEADRIALIWGILSAILLLVGAEVILRDLQVLFRTRRHAFLIRRIGRVRIFVSDEIRVPFSFWFPGQANIVVPSALIAKREDFNMAIVHELQHHRHGDTRWVYVLWGLKLICVVNPAVHLWNRWITEIQEFACDETLVDQNKVESQAYARCLVEVAQTAVDQKYVPVCATGLTFLIERNLLKRRIEKMLVKTSTHIKTGRLIGVLAGFLLTAVMAGAAYASGGLVQDRRVSLTQAQAMADKAKSTTGFPVVVNERVLEQLNRYIGTPEGRDFMRNALARLQTYKSSVDDYLKKYGVPEEILAVPIVESGYQNLSQGRGPASQKSAGLWQFIPETARAYGLKVGDAKDERLDTGLLTDAAMRYLLANDLRFKDWQLSLLAYNLGERGVQRGIDATGSRDVWTLIRKGYEGDKGYLPKVMAAILIMRNPGSVQ